MQSNDPRSMILLEFNELTPQLMRQFMAAGHLPNFQRFYDQSQVYQTDAEESGELLNPWVQWVTVHSGLAANEHGVATLSTGCRLSTLAIWDYLSQAGKKVWVCGSMNGRYDQPLDGYLLPDPWSTGLKPYPEAEFADYYSFVHRAVQEHTNTTAQSPRRAALAFVRYMVTHGMKLTTALAIARQLLDERRGRHRWRRASLMDQLQFDVFKHYYRKSRPNFATFFLNSTAHYQHTYWRNMQPELFQVKPSDEQNREYGGAILYGYRQMDALVGKFMAMADANTTLVFCTAMSQQPYLKHEAEGGRHAYRFRSKEVFTDLLKIAGPFESKPLMSDQHLLEFPTDAAADAAEARLLSFEMKQGKAFQALREGRGIVTKCIWKVDFAPDTMITTPEGKEIKFYDVFYSMNILKSGYHHPEGMLWVRRPDRRHAVSAEPVSIRAIAPSIMQHFGLEIPASMKCPAFDSAEAFASLDERHVTV